jgi:DNA-binding beta-propeller fold protein YncE
MRPHKLTGMAALALTAGFFAFAAHGQPAPPAEGPAENGSPAWFTLMPAARGGAGIAGRGAGAPGRGAAPGGCTRSPLCSPRTSSIRPPAPFGRVQWKQEMGYTISYPFTLPIPTAKGGGGISGVAIDSRGNLWAYQRNPEGSPQLFQFDANRRLVRTIGPDVIGHQVKAHGIAVDAQDNVWIADESGATVMQLSPEGRLLRTIGTRNRRGDWDEAGGQRLLWEPLAIAFGRNGDVYIGMGHANESPNDTDSGDPANSIGAARVLRLDRDGRFIGQWFGNSGGPGKFTMAHGLAVDPRNGDVWVGDREQYRLVVYSADGKFLRTVQMRNLPCAIAFDSAGDLWVASGTDGQVLKMDRNGKVLGAVGNGPGTGEGQFNESNYLAWDKQGNIYSGDTTNARITVMSRPR